MIHIKEYNSFNIHNEIEEYTKECFNDFMTTYGLEALFQYGKFSERDKFIHQGIYDEIINGIFRHTAGASWKDIKFYNSCQIAFINKRDRISKLEIHTDEESNTEFTKSVQHLRQVLGDFLDIQIFKYPNALSNSWYQIPITIGWE